MLFVNAHIQLIKCGRWRVLSLNIRVCAFSFAYIGFAGLRVFKNRKIPLSSVGSHRNWGLDTWRTVLIVSKWLSHEKWFTPELGRETVPASKLRPVGFKPTLQSMFSDAWWDLAMQLPSMWTWCPTLGAGDACGPWGEAALLLGSVTAPEEGGQCEWEDFCWNTSPGLAPECAGSSMTLNCNTF